jgi:hypothetical protein
MLGLIKRCCRGHSWQKVSKGKTESEEGKSKKQFRNMKRTKHKQKNTQKKDNFISNGKVGVIGYVMKGNMFTY